MAGAAGSLWVGPDNYRRMLQTCLEQQYQTGKKGMEKRANTGIKRGIQYATGFHEVSTDAIEITARIVYPRVQQPSWHYIFPNPPIRCDYYHPKSTQSYTRKRRFLLTRFPVRYGPSQSWDGAFICVQVNPGGPPAAPVQKKTEVKRSDLRKKLFRITYARRHKYVCIDIYAYVQVIGRCMK